MPFLSHVIQPVATTPVAGIGFADALTTVVNVQNVLSRTPEGKGSYAVADGYALQPQTQDFTVPAVTDSTISELTGVLLKPEPGSEWGNHVGIQSNILLTATAAARCDIYFTLCTNSNPGSAPRVMFHFEKFTDTGYRLRIYAQEPSGPLDTLVLIDSGLNRTGAFRFEVKVVNDNEFVLAANYDGNIVLPPTTYTAYDFSTRGTEVGIRFDTISGPGNTQVRGNDPGGQLQVDSIPTLIPA